MNDFERLTIEIGQKARKSAKITTNLATKTKNQILLDTAEGILTAKEFLQQENAKDLQKARTKGMSSAFIDRLTLSDKTINSMVNGLKEVAQLPDPVGEVTRMWRRPNDLQVGRIRIPLGVILMIYESRPNVTIDAAALCLKAGNSIILRGGSDALHSNMALAGILHHALTKNGASADAVQVVPTTEREVLTHLLKLDELIDLVIPRGGEGLIRFVAENSRIPVLKHYKGVCHVFVDTFADLDMAEKICINAKVQRPGVCNAMEGLLVHEDAAQTFLPRMAKAFFQAGVTMLGCPKACALSSKIQPAQDTDWGTEFLELKLVIRVVKDINEAMDYIARYGSNHTEAIVTQDYGNAQRFLKEVDASLVLVNASTRFNDGGELGLGAEIGISTSKLHAYGPMGLEELTTTKFIAYGAGQIRT